MILMAPCIIDFIGANELLGACSGGEGALDTPGPLHGIERSECHLGFSHAVVHFKCQKIRVYVLSQLSVEITTANISLFIKSTCFAPRFELLEEWVAAWNTLQTGARHSPVQFSFRYNVVLLQKQ